MPRCFFNLAFLSTSLVLSTTGQADIKSAVVVQPFVVADDEGQTPAPARIPEAAIDQIYGQAGIDVHFLEPRQVRSTLAQNGLVSDQEFRQHMQAHSLALLPKQQVNLFFVPHARTPNESDASASGEAQTAAIVTVALAASEASADDDDAYAIAHAIGHALGLSVDHASTNREMPHVMQPPTIAIPAADLRFSAAEAEQMHGSDRVRPRTEFLDSESAKEAICDDSYAAYFSRLNRREVATLTGEPVDNSISNIEQVARQRFQAVTRSFTDREAESIEWCVNLVRSHVGQHYALFRKQPYRFIKVADSHCGGFSHTRGPWIIFSQRTVDRFVEAKRADDETAALRTVGSLLVHEQLHVLQRLYSAKFAGLYADVWGFRSADVTLPDSLRQNRILNPDALLTNWLLPESMTGLTGRQFVCLTLLKPGRDVPRMGRDFADIAIEMKQASNGSFGAAIEEDGEPRTIPLDSLKMYSGLFETKRGLDHPNEIAAYLFQVIALEDQAEADGPEEPLAQIKDGLPPRPMDGFRRWCAANLQ